MMHDHDDFNGASACVRRIVRASGVPVSSSCVRCNGCAARSVAAHLRRAQRGVRDTAVLHARTGRASRALSFT
jgi:hypothetical protein